MNEAKNYNIRILNDEYVIQSDEQKEIIDRASFLVNTFMQETLNKSKHIDQKKVAVLTALRLAGQVIHLENQIDDARMKEQELVTTIESMC